MQRQLVLAELTPAEAAQYDRLETLLIVHRATAALADASTGQAPTAPDQEPVRAPV